MSLSDFIRKMVTAQVESLRVVTGEVTDRNDAKATITVLPPGQPEMLDVRLRAVETDTTGIVGYPKVGSFVTVAPLDEEGTEFVVILAAELEWFEVRIGGKSKLTLAPDGTIVFNDGSYGPLIQIQKLVDELTKLKNQVQGIKFVLADPTWHGALLDGGMTLDASYVSNIVPLLDPTISVDQFKNPDITHGPHA